jgi:hypothetical protein
MRTPKRRPALAPKARGNFPAAIPPTAEQTAWLAANPGYLRMSHIATARFSNRGTLYPDGRFVAEGTGQPVMDGNGAFGVGVPVPKRRR